MPTAPASYQVPAKPSARDVRKVATHASRHARYAEVRRLAATVGASLEGFASGPRKDLAVVRAALEMPWSTRPVEGRINRLKTIKLTMYGRAGFELLRSRTLRAA